MGERKASMARTQGEAFAGGKGEPEDAARRSFAAIPFTGVLAAATTQLFLADDERRAEERPDVEEALPFDAGFSAAGFALAAGFFAVGLRAAGFFAAGFLAAGLRSAGFFTGGFSVTGLPSSASAGFASAFAAGLRVSRRRSVTSSRVSSWRWPDLRR